MTIDARLQSPAKSTARESLPDLVRCQPVSLEYGIACWNKRNTLTERRLAATTKYTRYVDVYDNLFSKSPIVAPCALDQRRAVDRQDFWAEKDKVMGL